MDTRRLLLALALAAAALTPVFAQHDPSTAGHEHHSSYASQEMTDVASLSRREMDDLLAGAGMGLARAAELNHHPGPKHVLELGADLGLDEDQRTAVEQVHAAMLAEARRLGGEIVELERHLNRRFEHLHIDEEILRRATAEVADLEGELRFVHLRAHLETRDILSAEQIADYDRLRGYGGATGETREAEPAATHEPVAAMDEPAAASRETASLEKSLAQAERAFAAAAARRDRDGFASFMTAATVFSTPHGNLRGPEAILGEWAGFFATAGPTIGWEPKRVAVAGDGDGAIGLSSGPYWIEAPVAEGADGEAARFSGTFFSVWRRGADGRWKIVLDSGTEATPVGDAP